MNEDFMQNTTADPRGFGGAPDPGPQTNEDGSINATPEEQQDYDLLVTRARKMIFGKGKEKVLKMLGSSQSPAQGMGQAVSMLMKSLITSAKDKGRNIAPDVAINAATEIVEDLNDVAIANNVFQYDSPEDEESEMADAILWGVKYYGDGMIQNGEITPEMTQQAQMIMQEGLENEGALVRKTPIAEGVEQAMSQPQQGLIAGMMGGA